MNANRNISKIVESLEVADLTNGLYGKHCIHLIMQKIIKNLTATMKCHAQIHRNSQIVSLSDNYNYLNYPQDGAARDSRYTKYVTDTLILRTQTSSMIPAILADLSLVNLDNDVLLACPGIVYRRDVIDRLHVPNPHQLDLWLISKNLKTKKDLNHMISMIMDDLLKGYEYKLTDAIHPYTTEGVQIDVLVDGEWIEIGECGIAAQTVLNISGEAVYGLAMGLGLDRIAMIVKHIKDIRLLRNPNKKIISQMYDLKPYQDVSKMPINKKDISIAIEETITEEEIGDIINEQCSDYLEYIEEIKVISETAYNELPQVAIDRMGLIPSQKNVLLRIVLRHLSKTITTDEAKQIRNIIYNTLHQGSSKESDYV
jgi:phenylalanyl-tRNA synthetase alpha chain